MSPPSALPSACRRQPSIPATDARQPHCPRPAPNGGDRGATTGRRPPWPPSTGRNSHARSDCNAPAATQWGVGPRHFRICANPGIRRPKNTKPLTAHTGATASERPVSSYPVRNYSVPVAGGCSGRARLLPSCVSTPESAQRELRPPPPGPSATGTIHPAELPPRRRAHTSLKCYQIHGIQPPVSRSASTDRRRRRHAGAPQPPSLPPPKRRRAAPHVPPPTGRLPDAARRAGATPGASRPQLSGRAAAQRRRGVQRAARGTVRR